MSAIIKEGEVVCDALSKSEKENILKRIEVIANRNSSIVKRIGKTNVGGKNGFFIVIKGSGKEKEKNVVKMFDKFNRAPFRVRLNGQSEVIVTYR